MGPYGKTNPTASWPTNQASDLSGYILYFGSQSGIYTSNVNVGNVTSYMISNIIPIQRWYYFAVTAYDSSGNESTYSPEFKYYISDPYTRSVNTTITIS